MQHFEAERALAAPHLFFVRQGTSATALMSRESLKIDAATFLEVDFRPERVLAGGAGSV